MDIVDRLNGVYRTPITDGLGPAGGEEPDNPNEFVRTFQTPPIQKEAAATITALRKRVEELEGALEQLEAANEQLAATRSSETYCMMLTDDGAEDALEALDGARSRARAALRAKGGEHGDA